MRFSKGAKTDPETTLETLKLVIYLVPIFGFFPSLWSLYRRGGSRREQATSRTAVILALTWLLVYGATGAGAQAIDSLTARFLITGLLSTTGYFITNLWLMVRLLQGKSVRIPGLSRWGDRL
ncbi:MAG: hypothetical protein ACFB0C_12865 [Leptolyngbyaceae cyanobacterium]